MRQYRIASFETGDTSLGKHVFDIAKAEREQMIEPDGMADDFRTESVTFIERFHPSIIVDVGLT